MPKYEITIKRTSTDIGTCVVEARSRALAKLLILERMESGDDHSKIDCPLPRTSAWIPKR